jgi:hypothetical protein
MTNFVPTQQYESSSESDNDMDINQQNAQEKKTVRRKLNWVKERSFSDDEQAQLAIKKEKQWSRHYCNKVHDGIKVYYRCNQVKFRGKQCAAAIYLHYPHDSDEVVLFRTAGDHDHSQLDTRKILSEEAKEKIEELFGLRLKPKKIYEVLQEKNLKISYCQLNNYLTQLRKKKFGPSTLSLGELESICVQKIRSTTM